jgi:small subunit ribosomal protein S13
MYKFKDTNLQFNRRVRDSLSDVYGVGFEKASYVCDLIGLGSSFNINSLNRYFYELMATILKYNYFLDDRLKSFLMQRLVFFVENRRVAGVRLSKGLPNRGQRTHTNRKTALKLKPNLIRRNEFFSQQTQSKPQHKHKHKDAKKNSKKSVKKPNKKSKKK